MNEIANQLKRVLENKKCEDCPLDKMCNAIMNNTSYDCLCNELDSIIERRNDL